MSARLEADSPVPGGGALKWLSGSATPQNTSPMPMPAANSIANQEPNPNSASSSSLPSTRLPTGEKATQAAKNTKVLTTMT